jgi:hypothetical protein
MVCVQAVDHNELVGGLSDDNAVRYERSALTQIERTVTSNVKAEKLKRLLQVFIGSQVSVESKRVGKTRISREFYSTTVSLWRIRQQRR